MSGISITSGTFQITSNVAPFKFDNVSQSIMIQGAGPGGGTLISKIQTVFDSGSASIDDDAFTTVVDSPSLFGHDHRATIQGALNLAASATESLKARTVNISAGVYLIDVNDATASLFIQDGVILQGAGIGATRLVAFGGNAGQLIRHSESINRDFAIRDMTLDGAKGFNTGALGSTLIQFDCAEDFDLSNLAIVSASGDAVCITGSTDGTFRNIKQRANDRSDFAVTSSTRLAFSDVNTQGSPGFGLELVGTVSTSLVNVNLDSGGSGSLSERQSTAATSFVNFGDARFRTNDFSVFGTSVFANPVDQLDEYFIGTVPFKSKGQAHAFQTVSGSRTWLQFPLFVNNEITGTDLTLLGSNPGLAWVMDFVKGDNGIGSDEQYMALMGPGVAGVEASRLTPDPTFNWTAFYTCSLVSGFQCWSGSAFEFKQGHVTAPAFTGSFSGDGSGLTGIVVAHISASHALQADNAQSASHALQADNAKTADSATSSSHTLQADNAQSADTATSASHALQADNAATADFATSATSASHALAADVADVALSGTGSFTGSFTGDGAGLTAVVSVSHAIDSDASLLAVSAVTALTASFVTASNVQGTVVSASHAVTASFALNAGGAGGDTNSGSFTGSITGAVLITSGATGIHELVDLGIQSASFTVTGSEGNYQSFIAGGDLTLGLTEFVSGGVYLVEISNDGDHTITLPLVNWHLGTTPAVQIGTNLYGFTAGRESVLGYAIAQAEAVGGAPVPITNGNITGSFNIPSGSTVVHDIVDVGVQSASFTMSLDGGMIQKFTPGASIEVKFDKLGFGQINEIAIDNAGSHSVTLDPDLVWNGGVAGGITTGSNMITVQKTPFGNLANIIGQDIS